MSKITEVMIVQKDGLQESREIATSAGNVSYDNSETRISSDNLQDTVKELIDMINTHDTAPDKMDKKNPVGEGTFNFNGNQVDNYGAAFGKNTTATGLYSMAEGVNSSAIGSYSHAEGQSTRAEGTSSHAEGNLTSATKPNSHAEGSSTLADADSAHAEGNATIASGLNSHAEGNKATASGTNSHAGGNLSIAQGENSFSHGLSAIANYDNSIALGENVITNCENQIVIGQFNDNDKEYENEASFIVGIGEDENNRKNGFVVLKDGTAISSKDIKVITEDEILSMVDMQEEILVNSDKIQNIFNKLGTADISAISATITDAILKIYSMATGEAETIAKNVGFDNTTSGLDARNAQDAIDEISSAIPFKFGRDENGNYGYYKVGADSVTPFSDVENLAWLVERINMTTEKQDTNIFDAVEHLLELASFNVRISTIIEPLPITGRLEIV